MVQHDLHVHLHSFAMFFNFYNQYIFTQKCEESASYRKAAKGEHLAIYEEDSCVVTACCHLHARTRQGLHQRGRTPGKDTYI